MIRVLIAGEGPNELGEWRSSSERASSPSTGQGVIEAFLGKVRPGGWEVRDAIAWARVPKLLPGAADGEARTVKALVLQAKERGCHVLAFLRDRDGVVGRERSIKQAVEKSQQGIDRAPRVAGGIPVEMLESWLLALKAVSNSERVAEPVSELVKHGVPPKETTAMVQLVMNADLRKVPADAQSLRRWLRALFVGLRVKTPGFLR